MEAGVVSDRSTFEVIKLAGELDVARKEELHTALVIGASARAILLDMSEVTYADSTALTEMLRFSTQADRERVPVAIVATSPQLDRIIRYAGLNEVFKIFAVRGEALSYLESAS
jgi:anti-sigma B factor antagonist